MKKIYISALALAISLMNVQAQEKQKDTAYNSRKLKIEEINLVSSYYTQDGNNSAVTGGVGTEQLTDYSNNFELKLSKKNKKSDIHSLSLEVGLDVYTSASSDKIDPITVSSASSNDRRIYPSISYNYQNNAHKYSVGTGFYYSKEYDYRSLGAGLNFSKTSKDNNRELSVKLQAYFDRVDVILPSELRPLGYGSGTEQDLRPIDHLPRNSYNASFSFSQVINQRLDLSILLDLAYQEGLLGTRFHRVYFNDASARIENLPSVRMKLPLGIRANYFLGDWIVLRSLYRYYMDNWGLQAHTVSLESSFKITPFISLSPFYRYYNQTAVQYFKPYEQHSTNQEFYTSDYDLSAFDSHFVGLNARFGSVKGIFGIKPFNTFELRYGYYSRSNNLNSHIVTVAMKFK